MLKVKPSPNMLKIINEYRKTNNLRRIGLGYFTDSDDLIDSKIHKTHKGKDYTKEEWEAFEKEQWKDYKEGSKYQFEDDKEASDKTFLYDPEEEENKKRGGKGFFIDEKPADD